MSSPHDHQNRFENVWRIASERLKRQRGGWGFNSVLGRKPHWTQWRHFRGLPCPVRFPVAQEWASMPCITTTYLSSWLTETTEYWAAGKQMERNGGSQWQPRWCEREEWNLQLHTVNKLQSSASPFLKATRLTMTKASKQREPQLADPASDANGWISWACGIGKATWRDLRLTLEPVFQRLWGKHERIRPWRLTNFPWVRLLRPPILGTSSSCIFATRRPRKCPVSPQEDTCSQLEQRLPFLSHFSVARMSPPHEINGLMQQQ